MRYLVSFGQPKKIRTFVKRHILPEKLRSRARVPTSTLRSGALFSNKLRHSAKVLKTLRAPLIVRKVVGHSMLPVLPPGVHVVGVRYFRRLKPGRVVVIVHEGKEKIKRIDDVKETEVYVTGDHAEASTDSRHFGWLPQSAVKAVIVWPRAKRVKS